MSNSLVEQVYILCHSLHTNDRSNAIFIMDRATWDQLVQLLREHTRDDYWAQVLERGPENGDTLLGLPVVVTEAVTGLVLVTPVLPTPIEHSDYTNAVDEFYEGWNASENVTSPRSTDAPVNTNVVHEQIPGMVVAAPRDVGRDRHRLGDGLWYSPTTLRRDMDCRNE